MASAFRKLFLMSLVVAVAWLAACKRSHKYDVDRFDTDTFGDTGGFDAGGDASGIDAGQVDSLVHNDDCGPAGPGAIPKGSLRILILGPSDPDTNAIAARLKALLDADPSFDDPVADSQTIEVDRASDAGIDIYGSRSLMGFFYAPESRASRLAKLAEPWSHVVLLERRDFGG